MTHLLLAAAAPTAMRFGGALLEREDIDLTVVTTGRALLEKLNSAPHFYGLVILDDRIPEPSGLECVHVIRRLHARLPILVLSETAGPERLAELARLGIRGRMVLELPADKDAFRAWVDEAIRANPPAASGPNGAHTP